MFLFVPLHWVQVITGETAEGTYKGFSCMGLPYMGITPVSWSSYCVALRAGPLSNPPTITITGSSFEDDCSIFTGEAGGGILPTSMGDDCGSGGVWVGVVFPFSCRRRSGRSLGPASSNNCHPSTTAAWPWVTNLWPAATFLTATTKKIISSTCSTYTYI